MQIIVNDMKKKNFFFKKKKKNENPIQIPSHSGMCVESISNANANANKKKNPKTLFNN